MRKVWVDDVLLDMLLLLLLEMLARSCCLLEMLIILEMLARNRWWAAAQMYLSARSYDWVPFGRSWSLVVTAGSGCRRFVKPWSLHYLRQQLGRGQAWLCGCVVVWYVFCNSGIIWVVWESLQLLRILKLLRTNTWVCLACKTKWRSQPFSWFAVELVGSARILGGLALGTLVQRMFGTNNRSDCWWGNGICYLVLRG